MKPGVLKQIQSVVPPSPGDDGKPREWIHGPKCLADLPEAAYEFLEAMAERIEEREAIQQEHEGGNGDGAKLQADSGWSKLTPATTRSPAARLLTYGQTILEEEGAKLAKLLEGGRHEGALPVSMRLASAVKSGLISESDCRTVFTESLRQAKLPEAEIKELIDSAMAKASPRKSTS